MVRFELAKAITGSAGPLAGGYCVDSPAAFSFDQIKTLDSSDHVIFPGFCDVHVHFREPGFSYKETIRTGSLASARGGYTAVCTMPNLNPVPDSPENLEKQLSIIEEDAAIHVYPYGAITVGEKGEELADLEGMAGNVIAFFKVIHINHNGKDFCIIWSTLNFW